MPLDGRELALTIGSETNGRLMAKIVLDALGGRSSSSAWELVRALNGQDLTTGADIKRCKCSLLLFPQYFSYLSLGLGNGSSTETLSLKTLRDIASVMIKKQYNAVGYDGDVPYQRIWRSNGSGIDRNSWPLDVRMDSLPSEWTRKECVSILRDCERITFHRRQE